jgi:hypothetical protein
MAKSNTLPLTGKVEEPVYPSKQAEILRDVIISEEFHLKKGVFGNDISINGTGIIAGPIYANSEVSVQYPKNAKESIKLLSGISAVHSISVQSSGNFEGKPGSIASSKILIKGDVVSEIVKIDNAIVFGNIRAKRVIVNNATIVGEIFAEEQLVLENSRFISFHSVQVTLKGEIYCWLPYGFSSTPIAFEDSTLPDGKIVKSKLVFTGFGDKQYVEMGSTDIHIHSVGDGKEVYALNLGRRALNLKLIEEEFKKIESFIRSILIFDHLDTHSKEMVLSDMQKYLSGDELTLFQNFTKHAGGNA